MTGRLFRNDLRVAADGTNGVDFTDVTEISGIAAAGYGMGVAAGDIDNDGWTDLYLTYFGRLWRNNGNGTFTDVSARSGTAQEGFSVSAAFVDYDRDGWLDLYVGNPRGSIDGGSRTNRWRPAGARVRGVEALNRSDWPAAVAAFREGTALAPRSASPNPRLGTALAMIGKTDEAKREFEAAVAVTPAYAKAHYSLGVRLEDRGDDDGALGRYTAAVQSAPDYAQARRRLADVLRRRGRLQDALTEYEQ